MVRLKAGKKIDKSDKNNKFQFLMVRLKEILVGQHKKADLISIPYGAIKR